MKNRFPSIVIFLFVALLYVNSACSQKNFTYKTFGNVANYFTDTIDLMTFFQFKRGQHVAEIGAFDGQNIAGFSILTDSIIYYAQDIDSINLSQKKFQKRLKKVRKYSGNGNSFHTVIGSIVATNLPDSTFDKIFIITTFHRFSHIDEMISDIHRKLKTGGKLYILETKCFTRDHVNYTPSETIKMIEKHSFSLIKKDGKDINNSSGLYRLIFIKQNN